MNKTITVKGIGKVSTPPDCVQISITLESTNMNYQYAMEMASSNIEDLTGCLVNIGFDKKDIKTTNFDVRTRFESHRRKDGGYDSIFVGYEVCHSLQLRFDFASKALSKALEAIASCTAHPEFRIRFTVKDDTSIKDEMLRSATTNARRKAEVLCEASGTKLGELLAIDYNWGEINVYSNTRYDIEDECLCMKAACAPIEIEPEDINVSDSATFVWAIAD